MTKIIIEGHNKLSAVSEAFSAEYPYLRLDFFSKPHDNLEGNTFDEKLDSDTTVEECGGTPTMLEIDKEMTVSELESEIKEKLNLNVQVFRKSGKVWLETTTTDVWTLEHQNSRGEEASKA
ncbi:MAG: hypothetical protein MI810_22225 [Flavobacteriales bacterium]|jgi:hypothetical protein|nr:hypothetical protein [Flavobacteriales bacterium]